MLKFFETTHNIVNKNELKIFVSFKDGDITAFDEAEYLKNKTKEYIDFLNETTKYEIVYDAGIHVNKYFMVEFMTIVSIPAPVPDIIEFTKTEFKNQIEETYISFYGNLKS